MEIIYSAIEKHVSIGFERKRTMKIRMFANCADFYENNFLKFPIIFFLQKCVTKY